jgi:hypothetical protein
VPRAIVEEQEAQTARARVRHAPVFDIPPDSLGPCAASNSAGMADTTTQVGEPLRRSIVSSMLFERVALGIECSPHRSERAAFLRNQLRHRDVTEGDLA